MRKNIFVTISTQIGIQLTGLVTGIIVARYLGPEGRGELAAILAWVTVITYLGDLGLPAAYIYRSAHHPLYRRQMLIHGFIFTLIQWALLLLIGIYLIPIALNEFREDIIHLGILYLSIYVPISLFARYSNSIQQGAGNYYRFNVIRLTMPVSYLFIMVGFLIFNNLSIPNILISSLAGNMVALILVISFLYPIITNINNIGDKQERGLSIKRMIGDLKFGLSAHIGNLQPLSSMRLDVLALSQLLAPKDLGYYAVAVVGSDLLKAQGVAIGSLVIPEVVKSGDSKSQLFLITKMLFITLSVVVPAACIIFLFSEELLKIVYGVKYIEAAAILRVMSIVGILAACYRVLSEGLRGLGYPLQSTWIEVGGIVIGGICFAIFVPQFGSVGAAIALIIALLTSTILTFSTMRKFTFRTERVR